MLTNFSVVNFKNFKKILNFDLTNDAMITEPLLTICYICDKIINIYYCNIFELCIGESL